MKALVLAAALAMHQPPITKVFLPKTNPRDTSANYIVIHNDGGNLNYKATRLVLRLRGLSYHYFIARNGKIYQFMDITRIAKHAGVSEWHGLTGWNVFSIAICLQGTSYTNYTKSQYASLTTLVKYINIRYPDSKDKPILGHSDIAVPHGRKDDPSEHFELWRIFNDTSHTNR